MVFIIAFICSGCNLVVQTADIEEGDEPNIVSFVLQEIDPIENTGDIQLEYPAYFPPYIVSIHTYEEYRSLYPTCVLYNEDYFLTHGLIEYRGISNFEHQHHAFLKLVYDDNILTLYTEQRGPETHIININPLKCYDYFLEYKKPGLIDDVVLNFKTVKIRDKYSLKNQEDISSLIERIQLNNYILADVKIVLSLEISDQEQFFQELKDEYNLNELGANFHYIDYGEEGLIFELTALDEDIIDLLIQILDDKEDVYNINVNLHNYYLESGLIHW